jgi:hypothetical protein
MWVVVGLSSVRSGASAPAAIANQGDTLVAGGSDPAAPTHLRRSHYALLLGWRHESGQIVRFDRTDQERSTRGRCSSGGFRPSKRPNIGFPAWSVSEGGI